MHVVQTRVQPLYIYSPLFFSLSSENILREALANSNDDFIAKQEAIDMQNISISSSQFQWFAKAS